MQAQGRNGERSHDLGQDIILKELLFFGVYIILKNACDRYSVKSEILSSEHITTQHTV